MTSLTIENRLGLLANMIGVRTERLHARHYTGDQYDVFVDDKFRYGYFDGNVFFRENPIRRTLRANGVSTKEGWVGEKSEPQYDLIIRFNHDGTIGDISDNRTCMEAEGKR